MSCGILRVKPADTNGYAGGSTLLSAVPSSEALAAARRTGRFLHYRARAHKPGGLRPGMLQLLNLLCNQAPVSLDELEARALLDLAEQQRVLPFVVDRLRVLAPPNSRFLECRLASIEHANQRAAFWLTSTLRGVLAAFSDDHIAVVPLKGPSLAERIYGGAHLRSSCDLDLLVRRADRARAQELLTRLGFALVDKDNGYHELWRRDQTAIELHHDVADPLGFDFAIETAWLSTVKAEVFGQPAWLFSRRDELLFLCVHGAKHCFAHLGHVLDIALFLDRISEDSGNFVSESLLRPEAEPLAGVLALGCFLAQRLRPDSPLPFEIPLPRRRRAALEHFAQTHWQSLLTRPPASLRWMTIRSFYRGTEISYRGYCTRLARDVRDAAALRIEADIEFARHLGVEDSRSWLVLLLRYVRLLLCLGGRWRTPETLKDSRPMGGA